MKDMKKYGRIKVVKDNAFVEGLVVEKDAAGTEDFSIVARRYYINEFEEKSVDKQITTIDSAEVVKYVTPKKMMKEISRQLGTKDFYIDEDVIEFLESLL